MAKPQLNWRKIEDDYYVIRFDETGLGIKVRLHIWPDRSCDLEFYLHDRSFYYATLIPSDENKSDTDLQASAEGLIKGVILSFMNGIRRAVENYPDFF